MKRRLMTTAGILNTIIFIGAVVGSLYLMYLGAKIVYDTLHLGLTGLNGITAMILIFSTLITSILLLIGIVALIYSIIMLVNSKNLIKKAKLPDKQLAGKKGGIIAYIIFCILTMGGCGWFLHSELIKTSQNMTFIYVLSIIMILLFISIVFIMIDMRKKITPVVSPVAPVTQPTEKPTIQPTETTEVKTDELKPTEKTQEEKK